MSESRSSPAAALILGIFIAVGLSIAGIFLARAVESAKRFECFVTVKGLSEREVPADLGIWPVRFRVAANDLKALRKTLLESVRLLSLVGLPVSIWLIFTAEPMLVLLFVRGVFSRADASLTSAIDAPARVGQ